MADIVLVAGAAILAVAVFLWGESKRVPPVLRLLGAEEDKRKGE
jgi:hypothetical protein